MPRIENTSFESAAVQCSFGPMYILTDDVSREDNNVLSATRTPGNQAGYQKHLGEAGIIDSVTALMTPAEVERFKKIKASKYAQNWVHPLLKPAFDGFVHNFQIHGNSTLQGYLRATFTVEQHHDPSVTVLSPMTLTANGASKNAKSLWDDLGAVGDLPDLGDLGADDGSATAFNDAWGDLGNSWGALDADLEGLVDGSTSWREAARSLDVFSDAKDSFLDAFNDVEDFVGDIAETVQRVPSQIVQVAREGIEAAREDAAQILSLKVTDVTDLPSLILKGMGEVTDDIIESVMDTNGIDDPLCILPGTTITLPLREAAS